MEEQKQPSILDSLNYAKQFLRENANVGGYGYYRPRNPHDFHPGPECCSAEEIAAHKAACEAWDRGDYQRDDWDGWLYDEAGKAVMHVLRAPWSIGSYSETDEEMEAHAQNVHRASEQYPQCVAALEAVAPTLQRLLRAYREAVKLHDSNHDDAFTSDAHNALILVRAAINKAEGIRVKEGA